MYSQLSCVACGERMSLNEVHRCPPKNRCVPVQQFYAVKDSTTAPMYPMYVYHDETAPVTEDNLQKIQKMLARIEKPELVERDLSCPTCQRFFCKVKVPKDTPIAAICEGCLREGR